MLKHVILITPHFRNLLIQNQEQLQGMLNEVCNTSTDDLMEEEIIEEYLDDVNSMDDSLMTYEADSDEMHIFEVSVPSVAQLEDKTDKSAIIKLIDAIEERNQIILESTKPRVRIKGQKSARAKQSKHKSIRTVLRKELLKFEPQMPLLILKPLHEAEASSSKTGAIVLYSQAHKCNVCTQEFSTYFQLKRHQGLSHPLETPMTCCSQMFNYLIDYQKHQRSAHPRSIVCPFCGKILKSRKTFLVHKRCHQNFSERKFKCQFLDCNKAFNFKIHLENHERCHSGEKPFKCNRCSASFRQVYQLTLHNRKHDGIQCSKCRTRLKSKTQLQDHEKNCNIEKKSVKLTNDEINSTEV